MYCSKCIQDKPLKEFYNDSSRSSGKSILCRECEREKKRNNEIRKAYGITQQQYEDMLKLQNGVCSICGQAPENGRIKRLSIDHCHATGKIRGLLCISCNNGLGRFKDDPKLLIKAAQYLQGE